MVAQVGAIHLPTLALGLGVAVALFALRRWAPSLPGPLLVMLAAAAGVALAGPAAQGIAVIGPVPTTVPVPALPNPDGVNLLQLLPVALGIAVVGYSDVILTGRAFAARKREQLDANTELLAMGAANLANGFLAGFPVSSSASRTVIGDSAGSRTQLHSLVAAAMVLGSIFLFGPVLAAFPQAALGGVVVYAGLRLVDLAELRRIAAVPSQRDRARPRRPGRRAGHRPADRHRDRRRAVDPRPDPADRAPARRHPRLRPRAGRHARRRRLPAATQVPGLVVYRYDSPLFFANADDFLGRAMASVARTRSPRREWFVLNAEANVEVDLTAVDTLEQLRSSLDDAGHRVRDGAGQDGPARPAGRGRLRRRRWGRTASSRRCPRPSRPSRAGTRTSTAPCHRVSRKPRSDRTEGGTMTAPLTFQVTLDCADPHALAEWWSETIGWPVEPTDAAFIRQMVDAGHATEADTRIYNGQLVWATGAAISVPDAPDGAPCRRFLFQAVPEPRTVKNRMHLDVRVTPGTDLDAARDALLAGVRRSCTRPPKGRCTAGTRWPTPRATSSASPEPSGQRTHHREQPDVRSR